VNYQVYGSIDGKTQNKLTLGDPVRFEAKDNQDLILAGALASKVENQDTIDKAAFGALSDKEGLGEFSQLSFVPFDPVRKPMEATIRDPSGWQFKVSRGAPQVIFELCRLDLKMSDEAQKAIDVFQTVFGRRFITGPRDSTLQVAIIVQGDRPCAPTPCRTSSKS
jgi:magnesium-transporting ATPase (P-type)